MLCSIPGRHGPHSWRQKRCRSARLIVYESTQMSAILASLTRKRSLVGTRTDSSCDPASGTSQLRSARRLSMMTGSRRLPPIGGTAPSSTLGAHRRRNADRSRDVRAHVAQASLPDGMPLAALVRVPLLAGWSAGCGRVSRRALVRRLMRRLLLGAHARRVRTRDGEPRLDVGVRGRHVIEKSTQFGRAPVAPVGGVLIAAGLAMIIA